MNHYYLVPYHPAQQQMQQSYYSQQYGQSYSQYPRPLGSYLERGGFGAMVGLSGAGAVNLRRYQHGQVSGGEALVDTLKTGLYAGLATAAAGLVADRFQSPALSVAAALATGTAVMYALTRESQESVDE